MKRIALKSLLEPLNPTARKSLLQVARSPEVTFLILLTGGTGAGKKIMPAGPDLDFRGPQDFLGRSFDGMRPTSYVELATESLSEVTDAPTNAPRQQDRGSVQAQTPNPGTKSDTNGEGESRALRARLHALEEKSAILESRLDRARTHIQNQKTLIAQLKEKEHALQSQLDEYERAPGSEESAVDRSRLVDLNVAEDELIDRMDEYMRKEAELEQREDIVREREQALDDTTIYFHQNRSAS